MADMRYFAELNGETIMKRNKDRGIRCITRRAGRNVFELYVEGHGWVEATRVINFKSNPSRHECDARCMFASGKTMTCECSCGGKNHGKGAAIRCEAA
jgi:hypothetical protein